MSDGGFGTIAAHLDYPMLVVTTVHRDERSGCLVGFHTQCSIDPPRYVVWISQVNHTARVAALAEVFALHFLDRSESGRALAELFGSLTGDETDKFARCQWHAGPDGVPLLDDCPVRMVGRRLSTFDGDCDHVAYVLEPISVEAPSALTPLMFSDVRDLDAGHEVD